MPFESHDWWMAGAIVAACLTLYAVSRWLYYDRRQRGIQAEINGLSPDRDYGRVRERNPAVRMGSLPALKELESHRMGVKVAPCQPPQTVLDPVGQSAPTNLVPFERGYAFTGFSKRVH